MTGDSELDEAVKRRDTLIEYCASCMNEGDWHAVADAANDIRVMDERLKYLWKLHNLRALGFLK